MFFTVYQQFIASNSRIFLGKRSCKCT